jgi:hypothetical protein
MSGGGTWRRDAPQAGQLSESMRPARTQWPRSEQCGLTHCTVEPGINAIVSSPSSRPLNRGNELP